MDIQVSSNFERYLFETQSRDAALIRSQMASLGQSGRFEVRGGPARLAEDFAAESASESEVAECIRETRAATGYLLEPHTACGLIASRKRQSAPSTIPEVVLATAHPAKFAEAMTDIVGASAPLPARLSHLLTEQERVTQLNNDVVEVQNYIRTTTRAAR
jgi:threonine synthase